MDNGSVRKSLGKTLSLTLPFIDSNVKIEELPNEDGTMNAPVAFESNRLLDILNVLPDFVSDALRDYADNTGLSESQVLELAIASFLSVEAPTLAAIDPSNLKSYGEMKARLEFLETIWAALKAGKLNKQTINQAQEMGW